MSNETKPLLSDENKCSSCYREYGFEPVKIRRSREEGWIDSSIVRCKNPECMATKGGTLEDVITHIDNVFDYKYFGDYELTPDQLDAVLSARGVIGTLQADRTKLMAVLQVCADALNKSQYVILRMADGPNREAWGPQLDTNDDALSQLKAIGVEPNK